MQRKDHLWVCLGLGTFFLSLGSGSLVKLLLELKASLEEQTVGDLGFWAESRRLLSLLVLSLLFLSCWARLPLRRWYISFLSWLFSSIRNWYIFMSSQYDLSFSCLSPPSWLPISTSTFVFVCTSSRFSRSESLRTALSSSMRRSFCSERACALPSSCWWKCSNFSRWWALTRRSSWMRESTRLSILVMNLSSCCLRRSTSLRMASFSATTCSRQPVNSRSSYPHCPHCPHSPCIITIQTANYQVAGCSRGGRGSRVLEGSEAELGGRAGRWMEAYNNMTEAKEDQEVSGCEELEDLRQRVHLSSNKLLELTYNDNKYMDKLISYNLEAKRLINEDLTEEAMVYLSEAERILEYGASCGKSIDRNIIVTTLHNEACCYYKEADLPTAAKYLEGLIFNLKAHLDSLQSSPAASSVDRRHAPDQDRKDPFLWLSLEKKMELVQYYLKFCTINSQAKRREAALDAGRRVLQLAASLFTDLQEEGLRLTGCSEEGREAEVGDLRRLLREVRVFREQVKVGEVEKYVCVARWWVRRWSENKVVRKVSFALEKHVSNYSISEVIDMAPLEYRPDEDHADSLLNPRNLLRQILHFAMGYFTVSTEYRLIAEQLYKDPAARAQSDEFQRANIYHLLAILFLTVNLNCDLLFMKQVVSSYEHHFKTDLSAGEVDPQAERLSETLLFEPRRKEKPLPKPKDKEKKKRLVSEYEDSYVYEEKVSMKMSARMQERLKRSLSKKNTLSSSKKLNPKLTNETVLESSKNNGNRSISKNPPPHPPHPPHPTTAKMRSLSKESANLRPLKDSKPEKHEQKVSKKTNDEYQLGQTKLPRKRINSNASVDLSVSCRSRDVSKRKEPLPGKARKEGKGKAKAKVVEKDVLNKHYYL